MKKTAIVYWSGTGNTEAMANYIAKGVLSENGIVDIFKAEEVSSSILKNYDTIAFGCPSMGAEELEQEVFEPMFLEMEEHLNGRKIALFGSYGWGDGEWMRTWEERCIAKGAVITAQSVICNQYPDQDAITALNSLGASLSK